MGILVFWGALALANPTQSTDAPLALNVEQKDLTLEMVSDRPSFALGADVIFREMGFGPALTFTTRWSETALQVRPRISAGYLKGRSTAAQDAILASEFGAEVTHSSLSWRRVSLAGFVSVMPEIWRVNGASEFHFHGNGGILAILSLGALGEASRFHLTLSLGVDQSSFGVRVWF